jgi:hypothetical protein
MTMFGLGENEIEPLVTALAGVTSTETNSRSCSRAPRGRASPNRATAWPAWSSSA